MAEEESGDATAFPVIGKAVEQGEHIPFMEKSSEAVQEAASRREDSIIFPLLEGFNDRFAIVNKDLPLAFMFFHGAPPGPILPQSLLKPTLRI